MNELLQAFSRENVGTFQNVFQAMPHVVNWKTVTLAALDLYITEDILTPEEKTDILAYAKRIINHMTITDSFDEFKNKTERRYSNTWPY